MLSFNSQFSAVFLGELGDILRGGVDVAIAKSKAVRYEK